MEAWSKLFPEMSAEEKETTWVKMDSDKSGTLEVAELAAFFGFNWEGEAATEMTDDQILEALQVCVRLRLCLCVHLQAGVRQPLPSLQINLRRVYL